MLVAAMMASFSTAPAGAQRSPFHFQEATIAGIHAALASGELTCVQLVRLYLDRIAAYDRQGPSLNAIITVNPRALDIAAEMDRSYRADPASAGPLHCIPIILKDNFNTFDMPTSGGNVSMKNSTPPADAFTVARMRKAGALILAKANMQEFARGGMSISRISRRWAPAAIPASRSALRPPRTTSSVSARRAGSSAGPASSPTA
jgi:amidase